MSNSLKIRLLLLLLTLSFVATALTLNLTYHKEDVIESGAKEIERNLQRKETLVYDILKDKNRIQKILSAPGNEALQQELITTFTAVNNIYINTYKNGALTFWTGNNFVRENDAGLKNENRIIKSGNGSFEIIKQTVGPESIVFIIPVKYSYPVKNSYLSNDFEEDLTKNRRLDISSGVAKDTYSVHSINGKYLFSVKLRNPVLESVYSKFELLAWILAVICTVILITGICITLAGKGKVIPAILLILCSFCIIRLLYLQFPRLENRFDIAIFNPQYYYYNKLFPSVGDFLINELGFSWLLVFCYYCRDKIKLFQNLKPNRGSLVLLLMGLILTLIAVQTDQLFAGLITRLKINFDLTDIINLSGFSWLCIILLCVGILNLYLLLEVMLPAAKTISIDPGLRLTLFIISVAAVLLFKLLAGDFNLIFIIFAIVIFLRGKAYFEGNNSYNLPVFVFTLLAFAVISSVKLSQYQFKKEQKQRVKFATEFTGTKDYTAISAFRAVENRIVADQTVLDLVSRNLIDDLYNKLKRDYFDGYLSKYEFKAFLLKLPGTTDSVKPKVAGFQGSIPSGSLKISRYFYYSTAKKGGYNYFAVLPLQNTNTGLVVELKARTFSQSNFPEVLMEGNPPSQEGLRSYSVAFYRNNNLVTQHGKYIYPLKNSRYRGSTYRYKFLETDGYDHLFFKPDKNNLVVISKDVPTILQQIASVSFLFLVLLLFFIIVLLLHWLILNISHHRLNLHKFNWSYLVYRNKILYRTRIQASMVSAIITTLIIVGLITYFSILHQYRQEQNTILLDRSEQIARGLESKLLYMDDLKRDVLSDNLFADVNAIDLNLYDISGKLLKTTQPKIFEYGIQADRISPTAFVNLKKLKRSEFIDKEKAGKLNYLTAYKPIRNSKNKIIAFLSLPNYNYSKNANKQLNTFLNTLINIYALVLVTIGFFAVFVANKITYPLTLIQESLSKIKIGTKNEPIVWKRDDEIGRLIIEYNKMISALEDNAYRLAKSERESAWREMAKQIAHEIKNPLTPLKLGVQLLEKSWKENDPNFSKKFEKFSKSFIEQIESLSQIASEFSNFAKIPDTTFTDVNLPEVILQSIQVFSKLNDLQIEFENKSGNNVTIKGDRDYLLRIFNNLLKNAVEAIPDYVDGHIKVILEERRGTAHLTVTDNGKGIPENLRDRIFHPNFTTKSSGTGLGLAFVKQAVENMAGSVSFKTNDNEGTSFFIDIPTV